jgi:uncharacterized membrane protein YhaH (DUF805 family)
MGGIYLVFSSRTHRCQYFVVAMVILLGISTFAAMIAFYSLMMTQATSLEEQTSGIPKPTHAPALLLVESEDRLAA